MHLKRCLIVLLAAAPLLLAGCNAVKGLGKDLHDSTQNIQEWMEGDTRNSQHIESR